MAKNETNFVQVPKWIANIIISTFAVWAMGATALLYQTYMDVRLLKTALVAKGIIDNGTCDNVRNGTILLHSAEIAGNQFNQSIQND